MQEVIGLPRRSTPRTPVDEKLIGKRLQELRKQQGLTQVEIAQRLGINQSLVSQYERGQLRLHGTLVAALATILKASTDQILGLKPVETDGILKDRRFLKRLQKIDELPKRRKQALLKSLDMLLRGVSVA